MPTVTIFGDIADADVYGNNTIYSSAAAGSPSNAGFSGPTELGVGQLFSSPTYYSIESFIGFDTSVLTSAALFPSATLSLATATANSVSGNFNARFYDWGTTVTSVDFVAGSSLSGLTLLASYPAASLQGVNNYNNFTSQGAFAGAINKVGFTRMVISSSLHEAGTPPTGTEYVGFRSADTAGTTLDPKLVIVYTLPAAAPPPRHRPTRIWR